eukprot:363518-Chlamydomonas_euryale.AAC.2
MDPHNGLMDAARVHVWCVAEEGGRVGGGAPWPSLTDRDPCSNPHTRTIWTARKVTGRSMRAPAAQVLPERQNIPGHQPAAGGCQPRGNGSNGSNGSNNSNGSNGSSGSNSSGSESKPSVYQRTGLKPPGSTEGANP